MSSRRAAQVVALVVLLIGLVLAFVPVSADGIGCGNTFSANTTEAVGADLFEPGAGYVESCADALALRRWIAFGLMGFAGVALLFVLLTSTGAASTAERTQQERL